MDKTKIIIVDENDKIVGFKERNLLNDNDIYRVSTLWIENSKGDILLAQRSFKKSKCPGMWGPAVGGTIEEGETYDSNIIKEAEEEIGLKDRIFKKFHKTHIKSPYNYFRQMYYLKIDKELDYFKIQEEEVEKIRWFTKKELLEEIRMNPDKFLPSIKNYLKFLNKNV